MIDIPGRVITVDRYSQPSRLVHHVNPRALQRRMDGRALRMLNGNDS